MREKERLNELHREIRQHLDRGLIPFWLARAEDNDHGGFLTNFDEQGHHAGLEVASFGRNEAGELILKVVNLTPLGHRATIEIRNAPCLKGTAQVIEMSADSPDAENTLNHPGRIVPKECTLQGGGSNFAYMFPPGSITIMKICSQYGNESI